MSYSDKVIDHYNHPRNVGSMDKKDADVGTGLVGAPECGDVMKLQIRVNPQTNVIEDAKFKTFGCGSAIASSSLATEWVKGKTVDQALGIKNTEIVKELALPPVKIHCSVLAEDAIRAAIGEEEKAGRRETGGSAGGAVNCYELRAAGFERSGFGSQPVARSDKIMDQALKDETTRPAPSRAPDKGIQVTENAVKKIRSAMAKENVSPEQGGLRLGVQGGGCSGLSYNIRFDTQPRERDRVFQFGDVRVFVDPKSFIYLHGMTLDYQETLMQQGFVFVNPNSTKSCGCGSSFS